MHHRGLLKEMLGLPVSIQLDEVPAAFTQQPWIVRMTLLQLFKERERLLMPVQPAQDVCAQVIKFLAILRFVRSFDEGERFLISFAVA